MNVLIVGKLPPPLGGVTIHVSRLIQNLEARNIEYSFCSTIDPLYSILRKVLMHKMVHLHASNSYFRCFFALFCFIFRRNLVHTIHGNLGRFGAWKNFCDTLSVFFSTTPILINQESLEKALKINKSSVLISAFIKPLTPEPLSEEILGPLIQWKNGYSHIFCTNATSSDLDKSGREIYGGSELMQVFSKLPCEGLIFGDPTGHYQDYLENNTEGVPVNVHFINRKHSFFEILKISDCYIRATTTDGDSISVKEALSIGKPVIASDCVDRPEGCILFKTGDTNGLYHEVECFRKNEGKEINALEEVDKIIQLYR